MEHVCVSAIVLAKRENIERSRLPVVNSLPERLIQLKFSALNILIRVTVELGKPIEENFL